MPALRIVIGTLFSAALLAGCQRSRGRPAAVAAELAPDLIRGGHFFHRLSAKA